MTRQPVISQKSLPTRSVQKALPLEILERSVLVRVDSVQTYRGVDAETVYGLVESGTLKWVWDFNNGNGRVRQLRFLALEIFTPELCVRLTLANVLKIVLGEKKESFHGTEIATRLRLDRTSIHHFHHGGDLPGVVVGKTLTIQRVDLEAFLTARLVKAPEAKS